MRLVRYAWELFDDELLTPLLNLIGIQPLADAAVSDAAVGDAAVSDAAVGDAALTDVSRTET